MPAQIEASAEAVAEKPIAAPFGQATPAMIQPDVAPQLQATDGSQNTTAKPAAIGPETKAEAKKTNEVVVTEPTAQIEPEPADSKQTVAQEADKEATAAGMKPVVPEQPRAPEPTVKESPKPTAAEPAAPVGPQTTAPKPAPGTAVSLEPQPAAATKIKIVPNETAASNTSLLAMYKAKAAAKQGRAVITDARWSVHTDAATGTSRLRLVFDLSGPVTAKAEISATPVPRLIVHINGADAGKQPSKRDLDGKIAENYQLEAAADKTTVIINMPLMIDEDGYKVFTLRKDPETKRPDRVVIDINRPPMPVEFNYKPGLKGKIIAIDPGHGGSDPGAVGPNKVLEKNITLAIAKKLQKKLEKAGAKVVMTRQDDRDVFGKRAETARDELNARATIANNNKADVFLSIHVDSFTNPTAGGTTVYYYQKTPYDALLAQTLKTNLVKAIGREDRGAKPANFYVIKRSLMPAALIEVAFISNPEEEKLLNTPNFQERVADGLVEGLKQFFELASKRGGKR